MIKISEMSGYCRYAFLLACISLYIACNGRATAAAVMSVDLGSEWIKVGVVKPGMPMEIALNQESKRKTLAIIGFREGKRSFGEDAQTTGIRFPSMAYGYLIDLLGKTINHPIVKLYSSRFPYYEIVGDPERNTVVFHTKSGNFSVEELIAQILINAKNIAESSTLQTITECVLTVPAFFNQAERQALITAARLAKLKVLQLINDYAAAALNYGVFNVAEANENATNYIFYDMGAYKTTAAVIQFQLVKDSLKMNTPNMHVLGVGFDRKLGGLEMQFRLRDHLASEFNAMKLTKTDVRSSPRSMAKLFKEAGRVKNVLSANNDHYAQIEGLLDDKDFKSQVSRKKFEELCSDLWERVTKPIDDALSHAKLGLDDMKRIVLIGGGTRVPRVQEIILQSFQSKLSKNLNADEAVAIGAVYKAAELSAGFKVKKILLKDAALFPLQLNIDSDSENSKALNRVLFVPMSLYPAKKAITFNRQKDFEFHLQYSNGTDEQLHIEDKTINRVQVKVEPAIEEHKDSRPIGAKIYIHLDESGIINCSKVEYHFEKSSNSEIENPGIFAKLNEFFSPEQAESTNEKSTNNTSKESDSEEATSQETKPSEESNKSQEINNATVNESTSKEDTAEQDTDSIAKIKQKKLKKGTEKNDTIRVILAHSVVPMYPVLLETHDSFMSSLEKIDKINDAERARARLESSVNNLASFINDIREKLEDEKFASCGTDEEKNAILTECEKSSEWMDEYFENVEFKEYEDRIAQLKTLAQPIFQRYREHEDRPDAVKLLKNKIEKGYHFLKTAKTFTKDENPDKSIYTDVEIETLEKLLQDTTTWLETETHAQNQLERNKNLLLTVNQIKEKTSLIIRELEYLINKMKIWKPKIKPTLPPKSNATDTGTGTPAVMNATNAEDSAQSPNPEISPEKPIQNETSFHSEL